MLNLLVLVMVQMLFHFNCVNAGDGVVMLGKAVGYSDAGDIRTVLILSDVVRC